jgi:hypothetical protein
MNTVIRISAPRTLSDLVKFDVSPSFTREIGTLKAGNALVLGTPIAKDHDGKVVVLDPLAVDSAAECVGLSIGSKSAGSADQGFTYLARGPAIVADVGIVWPAGITAPQKEKATGDLALIGILIRASY